MHPWQSGYMHFPPKEDDAGSNPAGCTKNGYRVLPVERSGGVDRLFRILDYTRKV